MKVLTLYAMLELPMQERHMRLMYTRPLMLIVALAALAPPRSQGANLLFAGQRDIDFAPVRPNAEFEYTKFADRKSPTPNQRRMDRHAFRKHQIPRNRVGRKR